jgi:hypothetical protein
LQPCDGPARLAGPVNRPPVLVVHAPLRSNRANDVGASATLTPSGVNTDNSPGRRWSFCCNAFVASPAHSARSSNVDRLRPRRISPSAAVRSTTTPRRRKVGVVEILTVAAETEAAAMPLKSSWQATTTMRSMDTERPRSTWTH